jgi:hypothetical protein
MCNEIPHIFPACQLPALILAPDKTNPKSWSLWQRSVFWTENDILPYPKMIFFSHLRQAVLFTPIIPFLP